MKRSLFLVALICALSTALAAENGREQGTIVRMRMTECLANSHPVMAAISGTAPTATNDICAEYVLVSDKVVYLIIGKRSNQLIPLAETTRFHFKNNEVLIRVDDARRESRFHVKEMILRADWNRLEHVVDTAAPAPAANPHYEAEEAMIRGTRR